MLWWIAETTLVAGGLAGIALLTGRAGRLGPAARHALWAVVLIKLLTPPILSAPWALRLPRTIRGEGLAADHPPEPGFSAIAAIDPRGPTDVRLLGSGGEGEAVAIVADLITVMEVVGAATADASPSCDASAAASPVESPTVRMAVPPKEWPKADDAMPRSPAAWLFWSWGSASAVLAACQVARMARFAGRVRAASEAPDWLVVETGRLAARLGVRTPPIRTVDGLAVPMLWCLGRPTLLLPAHLVETLGVDRWRGVLAHELAHLRRGDPWFSRLALLAGWLWWWNPVYRLARRRLDAEAELACDAWVVWALPSKGERVAYAGTMLDICARLSGDGAKAPPLAPALGSSGAGGLLERRIQMILNDNMTCRLTLPGLVAPGLMLLLGLPSWTAARTDDGQAGPAQEKAIRILTGVVEGKPGVVVVEGHGEGAAEGEAAGGTFRAVRVAPREVGGTADFVVSADEPGRDVVVGKSKAATVVLRRVADGGEGEDEAVAEAREALTKAARAYAQARVKARGSEDEEAEKAVEEARTALESARAKFSAAMEKSISARVKGGNAKVEVFTEVDEDDDGDGTPKSRRPLQLRLRRQVREEAKTREPKPGAEGKKKEDAHEIEIDLSDLSELSKLFAPDSEAMKALESLGPTLAKALRERFGEGSEFDAKMKDLGARIEAEVRSKLGPGSEFDQAMKELSKALEETLGPGSEFERRMKTFVDEFERRRADRGEGEAEVRVEVKKDDAKKAKEKAEADARKAKGDEARARAEAARSKAESVASDRRIKALEERIEALTRELERLKKSDR